MAIIKGVFYCDLCMNKLKFLLNTPYCPVCEELEDMQEASEVGYFVYYESNWKKEPYGKGQLLSSLEFARDRANVLKRMSSRKDKIIIISVKSESGPIDFDEDGLSVGAFIIKKKTSTNPWSENARKYRAREFNIIHV